MSDENTNNEIDGGDTEVTWPRIITLKYPVDFGSQRITALEFRRGRAGDIKGLKLGETIPVDQVLLVASRLCGQPLKVIESLDVDDSAEVMALALDFYGRCLGGGIARSQ